MCTNLKHIYEERPIRLNTWQNVIKLRHIYTLFKE